MASEWAQKEVKRRKAELFSQCASDIDMFWAEVLDDIYKIGYDSGYAEGHEDATWAAIEAGEYD